ncbi:unnamed protein product, partial [Brassica rapa subsp. trilocularis]
KGRVTGAKSRKLRREERTSGARSQPHHAEDAIMCRQ